MNDLDDVMAPVEEPPKPVPPVTETPFTRRLAQAMRAVKVPRVPARHPWEPHNWIARQLGWHRQTMRLIRTGRQSPTADKLVRLAEVLGVEVAWLAFGTGSRRVTKRPAVRPVRPTRPSRQA